MQTATPVRPTSTSHNVEWVVWVGEDEEDGALVVKPETGERVRWETVAKQTFNGIDSDRFDASLRTVYGTEVEEETCTGDSTPDIIAAPMQSFEKHTLYLSPDDKEQFLSFFEEWGSHIDRYYQHEASLQVGLKYVDELGAKAADGTGDTAEERYAIRVEGGTWDKLQTGLLKTELEYPELDAAPRRRQYHGLIQTVLNHEDEVRQLAEALSEANSK